ncbi:hypothetical protein PV325_008243 [Microctonus aethiopoides]|nr:hypothetical protein PV325_008243 [Microctonus aethiopoides]
MGQSRLGMGHFKMTYNRILRRDNTAQPVQIYDLNTVTYGTRASKFLDDIGKAKLSDAEITQLLADREFQLQKWTSQWTRFVALIAFYVKTKLQNLWQLKQDWDDCLLQELHTKWNQYQQGLVHLKDIEIPRCTLREHAQHSNHIPIMCEIYSYAIKKLTLARFALCAALLLALLPKKLRFKVHQTDGKRLSQTVWKKYKD